MARKPQTFDEYMQDLHAVDYRGTDDNMREDFEQWLDAFEPQNLATHAEEYGKKMVEFGRVSVLQDFDTMCKADGMVHFTPEEWATIQRFFEWNKQASGWDHVQEGQPAAESAKAA